MTTYALDNGSIVRTENASRYWEEATYFDGNNFISQATGSQWEHQTLYRSKKGLYYLEHTSQWQGTRPYAKAMSNKEAAEWLLKNDHELPDELQYLAEELEG